jgi:hypothetical protein
VTGEINPSLTLPEERQGNDITSTFQGAGLLLFRDQNNFVRLERTAGVVAGSIQPSHKILFEVVKDGKQFESQKYSLSPSGPAYLLLLRRKGRVVCAASRDLRAPIVPIKGIDLDLPSKVKIGLSASNISATPFTATFENFALLSDVKIVEAKFANGASERGK